MGLRPNFLPKNKSGQFSLLTFFDRAADRGLTALDRLGLRFLQAIGDAPPKEAVPPPHKPGRPNLRLVGGTQSGIKSPEDGPQ